MRRIRCAPQWLQLQTRCIASTTLWRAPDAGYQCSACGKGFRLLNALNHHIATRHAGQAKALSVGADGTTSETTVMAKPATPPPAQPLPQAPKQAPPAAMPGSLFPGMFPGSGVTPAPLAPAPQPADGSTSVDEPGSEDMDKRLFVCTVCQKTFRLEAALQHHYQAKHGMEMPQSNPSASPATPKPLSTAFGVNLASVLEGSVDAVSPTQYVHVGESSQPSMPQYHLDVAPNAPEEGDLAAHWRLVNHCVMVGTVSEVQEGFVFEDRVLQCLVATDFDNPSPGDPDKDFHTVRVYGSSETLKSIKLIMTPNARVMISGRLRLVPQFDSITNKYYHHPVVMVPEGSGSVHSV
jgi:hypothetical protein